MSLAAARKYSAPQVFGGPGIAVGVSFFALGILYSESDFTLWQAFLATALVFALPAQVAHAELYASGASLFAIGFTMILINARFFPMTVSLFPLLHIRQLGTAARFGLSHFIALTSWACFMNAYPKVPRPARLAYFTVLSAAIWLLALSATMAGHLLAREMDPSMVTVALILNPVYFACMIFSAARVRIYLIAILLGMALYPIFVRLVGDYAVLACGLTGGVVCCSLVRWRGWETEDD